LARPVRLGGVLRPATRTPKRPFQPPTEAVSAFHRPFWGVQPPTDEPPRVVVVDLDEALNLLAVFEDCRDVLSDTNDFAVVFQVERQIQIQILSRKLGLDQGGPDVR
jgi:hypothetical protein